MSDPQIGDLVETTHDVTDGAWLFPTVLVPKGTVGILTGRTGWVERRVSVTFATGAGEYRVDTFHASEIRAARRPAYITGRDHR